MKYLKFKYIKYIALILFVYILFSTFIRIINFYTILFLIVVIYIFYNVDKKLFKKIVYKVIYKNKKHTLSFKNTYGAAKISLEGVEKINKKINDKVKVELLNYQKNRLEPQLKTGDYKVTLFWSRFLRQNIDSKIFIEKYCRSNFSKNRYNKAN